MIETPYQGATPEQLRSPLVQEFLRIHDMFRNQLTAIINYADDLIVGKEHLNSPQTSARVQALIQAGSQYTQILHFHHHAETDSLFPELQKSGLETEIVDRLNADHDEIGAMIDQFYDTIHNLAAVDPAVMDNDLRRLADALRAHLAYEETHVCPLMARWSEWPPIKH
jgi:iron-sulfur cluster repair protein YtfE (RIC family)